MNKLIRKRLVDQMMDAHVDWCEACVMAGDAYGAWASTTGPSGRVAFGRYVAAVDGEELAARSTLTWSGGSATSSPASYPKRSLRPHGALARGKAWSESDRHSQAPRIDL
jgi:hypothetical protein